jgi:undecaprenyl diphosphate synthase
MSGPGDVIGVPLAERAAAAERCVAAGLDPERLPRHVAIVMDGNGRWAQGKGWERTRGHKRGTESVRAVTTGCAELGIERLTLYAFSSENWSRPRIEVEFLMRLLADYLRAEVPTLQRHRIRLEAIGQLHRLPEHARTALDDARSATAGNASMVLSLALSYGGRDEIADACRAIAQAAVAGALRPEDIDAATVGRHLYAPHAPDVDVVVRSAGEQRLSNFLLWEASYAEYVAIPTLWPDFGVADLHAALREYQGRARRFGGI